jgi:mRNA-degrading endonuclease RelE of RelBE toxin-antitoxin system
MQHEVVLHPKAADFLKKTEKNLKKRLKDKIKTLQKKPNSGKALKYSNFKSLRVGDYRVIYEVKGKKIIVLFIGHRKNVYEDFVKLL